MTRIRLVGICLVAVLSFSAVALASGAQAAEYRWCRAVKKTGNFTESGCRTVAEKKGKPDHKGGWEAKPVEACEAQKKGEYTTNTCTVKSAKAKKGTFEKTTGRTFTDPGSAKLTTPAFGPGGVECTASTTAGELIGPRAGIEQVTFTGCEYAEFKCESAGPNSTPSGVPGEIITNLLDSLLIGSPETLTWLNAQTDLTETSGPVVGEAWTELSSGEHEPFLFEIDCGGVAFLRTQGEVSGPIVPLGWTNTTMQTFAANMGAQGLLTEMEPGSGWTPPGGEPSTETTTETINYTTLIDIIP